MLKQILNKVIYAFLIFFGVSILTFVLGRLAPGDGLDTYLKTEERLVSEEEMELAREKLGLDKPIAQQYLSWMKNVLRGDFGISYNTKKPVLHEITIRLPKTLLLTVMAITLGLLISVPIAWLCTIKNGSLFDQVIRLLNTAVIALPVFCIGLIIMLIFGVKLKWLPIVGGEGIIHYVMPAGTLGLGMTGGMIRYFRTQFLESYQSGHIRYARAMGVGNGKIFCNHIVRPLLPQIITYVGLRFAGMLGGSYIIESMFSLNGSGGLLITSVSTRDYPMIQGYAVMMAAIYVSMRFVTEAVAALFEPRQRLRYEVGT